MKGSWGTREPLELSWTSSPSSSGVQLAKTSCVGKTTFGDPPTHPRLHPQRSSLPSMTEYSLCQCHRTRSARRCADVGTSLHQIPVRVGGAEARRSAYEPATWRLGWRSIELRMQGALVRYRPKAWPQRVAFKDTAGDYSLVPDRGARRCMVQGRSSGEDRSGRAPTHTHCMLPYSLPPACASPGASSHVLTRMHRIPANSRSKETGN